MKKFIRTKMNLKLDLLSCESGSLQDLIDKIEEAKDQGATSYEIDWEVWNESLESFEIEFFTKRIENDIEYAARLREEKEQAERKEKYRKAQEEREYRQYQQLKEKYEKK
jgi:hypothetical protein